MEPAPLPARRVLAARPRWYMPTPGKLVALLLLSVVVLYLSDQYDWFAFNKEKGWTVLIASACVTAGLGLILVWAVIAFSIGRRAQFGLLSLLLVVPTVSLPVAWLTREMQDATQLAAAIKRIEQGGGSIDFCYRTGGDGRLRIYIDPRRHTPAWLRAIFGDEFFAEVGKVTIGDSKNIAELSSLRYLRTIDAASGVVITDSDLDVLASFPFLHSIFFLDTQITDGGLKKLEKIPTLMNVSIFESRTTSVGRRAFAIAVEGRCTPIVEGIPFSEEFGVTDAYSPEALDKRSIESLEDELKNIEERLQELKKKGSKGATKSSSRTQGRLSEVWP